MSASQATVAVEQNPKLKQLTDYLIEETAHGQIYVKSKQIATEIDLSSKEIGALMLKLSRRDQPVSVEKWARSRGVTWCVSQHTP